MHIRNETHVMRPLGSIDTYLQVYS